MSNERETFEGWCVLELLGHRRLAGWVSEREIAGQGMICIHIPNLGEDSEENPWSSTQFYSAAALYSIIPCGKEEALAVAESQAPHPIQEWDVRALLPEIKEEVRREIQDEVRSEYQKRLETQKTARTVSYDVDYDDEVEGPF